MRISDRRQNVRFGWDVPVKLRKDGLDLSFEGRSVNVSQGGAFIRTENWPCFQVRDRATVVCFLPPGFTGQDEPICLLGDAIVRRVDQVNEAVAVEFVKNLKQFEPVQQDAV